MAAGSILELESLPTLSDATAGGVEADAITFGLCQSVIDRSILVEEAAIAEALRQQLEAMQQEQQQLKAQMEALEEQVGQQPPPRKSQPSSAAVTSGTRFNPQISAILDGNYYHDTADL